MARAIHCKPFPGRAAVLKALKAEGSWTARDVFNWARQNGGSEPTYAALDYWTRRGRITYTPNLWVAVASRSEV